MQFTVADTFMIGVFKQRDLLAGHSGLGRPIQSVTVVDAPDAWQWIRGGEFVMTTAFCFKENEALLERLISHLASRGAAALGIKTERFIGSLSPKVLSLADGLGFPIISVSSERAWIDIICPIMKELFAREFGRSPDSERVYRTLTDAVVNGGGIKELSEALYSILLQPVLITDASSLIQSAFPEDLLKDAEQEFVQRLLMPRENEKACVINETPWTERFENEKESRVIVSIPGKGGPAGYWIILETRRKLDSADMSILSHACNVATLLLRQEKSARDMARRFKDDFIVHLLNGEIETRAALRRAKDFSWHLGDTLAVCLFQVDVLDEVLDKILCHMSRLLPAGTPLGIDAAGRIAAVVTCNGGPSGSSQSCQTNGLVCTTDELPSTFKTRSEALCTTVTRSVAEKFKIRISAGIGRPYRDILSIPRSYREAERALTLGSRIAAKRTLLPSVTHYVDLGIYRFFNTDNMECKEFFNEVVSPLIRYNQDHKSDLISTLATFFDCECNFRETGRRLFIHPNTVRYRLKTVERITGLTISNPEDRLLLQVGLKMIPLID
ncbi:MAG TPA: hypothetical protein GX507_11815 [Clostridia bacterium]|nr:hypothetical protein [Clostridia bacterium]